MPDADRACEYWDPRRCAKSAHCPPRCPRFVDREGAAWTVRPADGTDRAALVEMYADFAPSERAQGVPPRKRERIDEWVADLLDRGSNVVVAGDGRIVGHALYAPTDDDEPEFAVFVHQDYQERGIGTEASKRVLAAAAVADRTALTLLVDPENRDARRLYDRLGFEIVEQVTYERRGRRNGAIRMRRPLSETDCAFRRPPLLPDGPVPSGGSGRLDT